MSNHKLKKTHTLQHDQTDCGVACLKSIIQYYGGHATLEKLRDLSGTSIQGTSLLGLQQAAEGHGLEAEAFEVDDLAVFKAEAVFPCILHVLIDEKLEHYVVCYKPPAEGAGYLIGDPAKGLEEWTEATLIERWKTRAMLNLKPSDNFEIAEKSTNRKWTWFKALIKEDLPILGISSIMGILIAVLSLSTAYFSQKLIDDFLPNHKTSKLLLGLGLLFFILLAKAGLGYIRSLLLLRQSKDFNSRVANTFYQTLMYLPKAFFDNRKTGDLIARMNDTRRIQTTIIQFTGVVFIDAFVVLISLVFVFFYSWLLGMVCVLSLPLFGVLVYYFNKPIAQQQKAVMANYARNESNYIDTINGIGVIKAYGKEDFFSNITQFTYSLFQDSILSLGRLGNKYNVLGEILNTILLVGLMGLASWMVIDKQLKLGEMMAVITIASGIIASVARLANTNIQLQEAKVAFNRMFEFMDLQAEDLHLHSPLEEIGDSYSKESNTLSVNDLGFRFAGRNALLQHVSLRLEKGKVTALRGEIGSGKCILLSILQRFYSIEEGTILLGNTNIYDIPLAQWRAKLGVVEQDIKIFNGFLIENIVLGNVAEEAEKAMQFCKEYGFDIYFSKMPQAYMTIVGEEGINLSGGQKQLIALARAMYKNPEILLLDEPTAAMDKKTEVFVMDLIQKIKKDKMILMVSHRSSIASVADYTFQLEDGVTQPV
jgi:ATP-binding cassette, subfamily C, bacteriocin exporter